MSDRAPHRSPEFIKFWVGQSLSLVGSKVSQLAMLLLAVLSLGASPGEMGVLRAVNFAPYLLSLPVGVLVDRTRRRPLLIGADLLRALLLGYVPLAAALGVVAMPQLYVVAALSGALTLVFGVAYTAYLPGLVAPSRLMEANTRLELSRSAAHAGGPGWRARWSRRFRPRRRSWPTRFRLPCRRSACGGFACPSRRHGRPTGGRCGGTSLKDCGWYATE